MPKKRVDRPAGTLKRFAAFVIDLVILNTIVLFPFKAMFKELIPSDKSFKEAMQMIVGSGSSDTLLLIGFITAIVSILYFALFEMRVGQTPGKMIFKISVVTTDMSNNMKSWQLIARSLFLTPYFPLILLWIIDPIVLLYSKQNQRLSEIISKTRTVEKE